MADWAASPTGCVANACQTTWPTGGSCAFLSGCSAWCVRAGPSIPIIWTEVDHLLEPHTAARTKRRESQAGVWRLSFSLQFSERSLSGRKTTQVRPDSRHRLNGTRQRRYAAIPNVKRLDGQASGQGQDWHIGEFITHSGRGHSDPKCPKNRPPASTKG
jgi:hypothetical protein